MEQALVREKERGGREGMTDRWTDRGLKTEKKEQEERIDRERDKALSVLLEMISSVTDLTEKSITVEW